MCQAKWDIHVTTSAVSLSRQAHLSACFSTSIFLSLAVLNTRQNLSSAKHNLPSCVASILKLSDSLLNSSRTPYGCSNWSTTGESHAAARLGGAKYNVFPSIYSVPKHFAFEAWARLFPTLRYKNCTRQYWADLAYLLVALLLSVFWFGLLTRFARPGVLRMHLFRVKVTID